VAIKPFRADAGVQMSTGTAAWNGATGVGGLYYKTGVGLVMRKTDNSEVTLGAGGGASFPLTNATSTNTYTCAVADGASAVAHEFNTTNSFATDGDLVFRVRANSVDWFKMGRATSQNAFTFTGNSNGSGTGPVFIVAPTGNAGLTLDATGGGGRVFQHYSTTAGEWVLADLTAGQNRWKMDANGALAPYATNTVNLGLPTNLPAAVYTNSLQMPQIAATSGAPVGVLFTGAAHTGLSTTVEVPDVDINAARIVTWAAGTIVNQRAVVIRAPTYAFASASTITTATTLSITGPPIAGTNATLTNKYALNLESGDLNLNAAGARVIAQHFTGRGSAPSIAVGAAAQLGTSPSAAVNVGSDTSGTLTITTGTTPSALTANTSIVGGTVTFASSYTSAPKGIVLTPSASASAAIATGSAGISFYVDQATISTTQFVVRIVSPTAASLGASTAYQFAFHVIQ
jgi:hypothetical protein